MNFILNRPYDTNNIFIMDGISNNVIENGLFHRLIFSNSYMTINALIFKFTFENISLIKNFNKYKLTYSNSNINNMNNNLEIIKIENEILNKFNLNRNKKNIIHENINFETIKLYSEKELNSNYEKIDIYLKISGIWVNDNEYGLTFKFSC